MSSRLFQRIREERGLAYSIYTFSSSYTDTGQFGVYAGCQPGKADEVISLMIGELAAVADGGLTEAEVQRGKGQMCGGVVLGLEDSGVSDVPDRQERTRLRRRPRGRRADRPDRRGHGGGRRRCSPLICWAVRGS